MTGGDETLDDDERDLDLVSSGGERESRIILSGSRTSMRKVVLESTIGTVLCRSKKVRKNLTVVGRESSGHSDKKK